MYTFKADGEVARMIDSRAAEQSVIGAILFDPDRVLPLSVQRLREEDFSLAECGHIFKICKKLFMDQDPVDIVTVLHALGGGNEYKVYLAKLAESVVSLSNVGSYIEIVETCARRRRALEYATQLQADLVEGETLEQCQGLATKLSQALGDTRCGVSIEPSEGFMQTYVGAVSDKPREYIKTGFYRIDKYARIDRGDYIVVGGRPSAGKTALTLQIMLNMAKSHKVVYFSLETKAQKIYDRLVSCYTHTPFPAIKDGQVKDATSMAAGYTEFSKLHFAVVEAAGWTVEQVKAKSVELGAEIVFIDYLSLIHSEGKNRYEKTTNISLDLHVMAQQSGITVIALSQLSRGGDGKSPELTDLRESGQIEQDADLVLLLSEVDPDQECSDRYLKIAKNKEGSTGTILLSFAGGYQTFHEVENRYG